MPTDRLNTRLPERLAKHVDAVVHEFKTHETSSEYIRDLIRRDMENEHYKVYAQITEGFRDFAEGRLLESTGNFEKDMNLLSQREVEEWK